MAHRCPFFALLSAMIAVQATHAAEPVTVIIDKKAPAVEKLAANELAAQFRRLFEAKVTVTDTKRAGDAFRVIVGSPQTNAAVRAAVAGRKLTEQGIVLTNKGGTLYVVGGSPRATLWAVYELGYRFGIRYLLREDIYPKTPISLKLDGIDVSLEPQLRTRTWRTVNDFAIGPESWPLAEHKRVLRQLAKMKFNRVMLSVYPWQPFVHYEFRGVKKQTGVLWYGERFDIPRDAAGKKAFGGKAVFENPDFAGKTTYGEMTAAGIAHLRGIIAEAKRLGMTVGLSISPLEFPKEFAKVLPGAKSSRGLNDLLVAPGAKQGFDDRTLKELVATKIRAYLKTYPGVDALYLTLPEFPEWDEHAAKAWNHFSGRFEGDPPALKSLLARAAKRSLIAAGRRGERALKGNIVALAFLDRLFQDGTFLKRSNGKRVELVITALDPELFSYAKKLLPKGAAALNFVNYTARRVAANKRYLSRFPAKAVRSRLIMTLADDNVGVLPQSNTRRLASLVEEIRRLGWDGFSTRYWMPAELDPSVHFLSRAAWDPKTTARSAHDELFTTITGKQSISDRLWLAFGHIEQATELIDRHELGFAFPVKGMLMKHDRAEPPPKWWKDVETHYTQAMIELYRSRDPADIRAQPLLFYYAKRGEYVLDYLKCLKELRAAALARKQGKKDQAIEHFETAVEAMYNAINTLSDVARDQSDRGLIAVLNKFAYRPLLARYNKLAE